MDKNENQPGRLAVLGDFQFVKDGQNLLESRSLVGVSVPADVNDSLEVMVDKLWHQWPGILLCNLG